MSASRIGKTLSDEAKAKISANVKLRHAAAKKAGVTLNGTPLMGYALKQDLHRIDELAKAGMLPPGPYEQTR